VGARSIRLAGSFRNPAVRTRGAVELWSTRGTGVRSNGIKMAHTLEELGVDSQGTWAGCKRCAIDDGAHWASGPP
jgi:hypothetical protein